MSLFTSQESLIELYREKCEAQKQMIDVQNKLVEELFEIIKELKSEMT